MKNLKKVNTIHKIILNFILSLALCFGMFSFSSTSVSADEEHAHDGVTFTAWSTSTALPSESGKYYLTTDVTLSESWWPKDGTVLCLNGHTIKYIGSSYQAVITITVDVTLTIYDCDGNGTITGGTGYLSTVEADTSYGGGIYIYKGILNMYRGIITENSATNSGGGIANHYGTVNLNSVTIINNTTASSDGGISSNIGGSISINECIIKNNSAQSSGGGIYNANEMNISNSTIKSNTSSNNGGGINNSGTLTLSDSTIDSNTSGSSGGGIYLGGGMTISGSIKIQDNTCSSSANNVYIPVSYYDSQNETYVYNNKITIDTLSSGSNIGITMQTVYNNIDVITKSSLIFSKGGSSYIDCFFSDDTNYAVATDGTDLKLVKNATWTWNDDYTEAIAYYTIADTTNSVSTTNITSQVVDNVTCLKEGITKHTATLKISENSNTYIYTNTTNQIISATGHSYGQPVFIWEADGSSCYATFTCENDSSHVEKIDASISSAIKVDAICTTLGITTYTATVTFNGNTYTDTLDVEDIAANGHVYDDPTFIWSSDGTTCAVMAVCQNDNTHVYIFDSADIAVTSEVKTAAKCTTKGTTTYTATVTFNGNTYTDTIDVEDIATGHTLQHVEAVAATETKNGNIEYWYCKECDKYYSDANGTNEIDYADVVIKALGQTTTNTTTTTTKNTNNDNTSNTATTASNNPQTSDNVSYMIYVVGIVLSGLYVVSRRRKYNQ